MEPQYPYSNNTPSSISAPSSSQLSIRDRSKLNMKPLVTILTVALIIFSVVFLPRQIIKPSTLIVSGVGKISTIPQSVSLVVTRTNVATDPAIAIDAGEAGLNTLINEAKEIVGTDAEIQKSFYTTSISSAQQNTSGQATIVKIYQISNGFKITFKDVSKTNELIKTLYSKGASSISSVSFLPADKDKTEQDARKLAFANAKIEADKIAKAMGKRVGRVLSFADDQAEASSTVSSSGGTFGTESIDIAKTVSVSYEIW